MNENETENFTDFIELKLREYAEWIREYGEDILDADKPMLADHLSSKIRLKFYVKQKFEEERFLLIPENEAVPVCVGCFNEFGSCGTPCVNCPTIEKFNKKWKISFWVPDKYRVYEKS